MFLLHTIYFKRKLILPLKEIYLLNLCCLLLHLNVKTFHYFHSLTLVGSSRLRLVCASIEIVLRVGLFM